MDTLLEPPAIGVDGGRRRIDLGDDDRGSWRLVLAGRTAERNYDEAVVQAVETADWCAIVDLVLEAGLDVIGCGRADDLVSWLDRLPDDVVAAESGVAVIAAMALWIAHGDRESERIDEWLERASETRRGRPPGRAESLSAAIDASRAAFGRGGPRTRKLLAERAIRSEAGHETAWVALSHAAAGLAAYLDDQPRAARRALTGSLAVQTRLGAESRRWVRRVLSPTVLGVLALVELEGGGHDDRADALISAAELQTPRYGAAAPGRGILDLAKSRAASASGDREGALQMSLETARGARLEAFQILGYLDAASIHCERGEVDLAASCLAAADELMARAPDSGRLLTRRRRAIGRQVRLGRAARSGSTDSLTEREAEVLGLLETDLSRREIAEELYLSFETVKTYVRRLYQKLGVSSRGAAVATARSWGWLDGAHEPGGGESVTTTPAACRRAV